MPTTHLAAQHSSRPEQILPLAMLQGHEPSLSRVILQRAASNELLAKLSHARFDTWLQQLESVELSLGKTLFDSGVGLDYVYFPTTAIVSLLYVTNDGNTTEVALVGHEGMVGLEWGSAERTLCRAVVQTPGQAFRLKSQVLREAVTHGGALPQLLFSYTNALFAQVAHKAIGGRRSSIMQTLSRWLLDRVDRAIVNELKITHEEIAAMLGVRRESITEAMGKLQSNGTLQCRRGVVAVLDRTGLEQCAGRQRVHHSLAAQLVES